MICVMVNGKTRHPQSQGTVEWDNGDIKHMLVAWMADILPGSFHSCFFIIFHLVKVVRFL